MSNIQARINYLKRFSRFFPIAKLNSIENKPSNWITLDKINEPIENYSFRGYLPNELIIELDKPTFEENKQLYETELKPILLEKQINAEAWTTQSKSIHLHLFFDKPINNDERYSWICETFGKQKIDSLIQSKALDNAFFTKTRQLIALEFQTHYKSKKPKILVDILTTEKPLNHFELTQPIQSITTEQKNKTIKQILADSKASYKDRFSLLGKLQKINPTWTIQQYSSYIKQNNKWEIYDEDITFKHIETFLDNYYKTNPIKEKVKEERQLKKLNFISSKELMETPKEKNFIVQSMIQPNTVNQIYSPPACFKSLICLYLALCVSNGIDFLGFKVKKGAVAYLDKENNRQLLTERVNSLFKGMGLKRKTYPVTFLLKQGMLDDDAFIEQLADYFKENKIKLAIFDTLVRFNSGEENSAKDMNKLYQAFVKLQEETNTAILFLHHTNRNGEFRGSSDLLGQVDTQFSVERNQKSTQFKLINTKNRLGEIKDISGEVLFSEGNISIIRNENESEQEETNHVDKFARARGFVCDYAKMSCPSDIHTFKRSDLIRASIAFNADKQKEYQISKRLIDSAIYYLKKNKIIRETEKRGEFTLNHAENSRIDSWIGAIGEGSA